MAEEIIFTPTHQRPPPHIHPAITSGLDGVGEEETQTSCLCVLLFFIALLCFLLKCRLLSFPTSHSPYLWGEKESLLASNETFYVHALCTALIELLMSSINLNSSNFVSLLLILITDILHGSWFILSLMWATFNIYARTSEGFLVFSYVGIL